MIMRKLLHLCAVLVGTASAAPPLPAPDDLYGWELPKLVSIDTIDFPRRLKRNRSFGRVVAEIKLRYDGSIDGIHFAYVENGDLARWAEKILETAKFTPARLDGSQQACRLPAHVLFLPKDDTHADRYEIWLPTDTTDYRSSLRDHFLMANHCLPPLLIRVGSYAYPPIEDTTSGTVVFEVYVNKDGSRTEGRLISSPGDEYTREALAAMLDMRILPPRFRNVSYGCWVRILIGFFPDWELPTRPVNISKEPYTGWPAPALAAVGTRIAFNPVYQRVDTGVSAASLAAVRRAADIVYGQAAFCAKVNTRGKVVEWFPTRPVDPLLLASDTEYSRYKSAGLFHGQTGAETDRLLPMPDIATLAATEMENIIPYMYFLPARDRQGRPVERWVTITTALRP